MGGPRDDDAPAGLPSRLPTTPALWLWDQCPEPAALQVVAQAGADAAAVAAVTSLQGRLEHPSAR
eukprot:5574594-Alexandrium_andersonii.AAC.1